MLAGLAARKALADSLQAPSSPPISNVQNVGSLAVVEFDSQHLASCLNQ